MERYQNNGTKNNVISDHIAPSEGPQKCVGGCTFKQSRSSAISMLMADVGADFRQKLLTWSENSQKWPKSEF